MQRLQNRVIRGIGKLERLTTVRELHVAFKITYMYDYITKLCMAQAEEILNHLNPNVRGIGYAAAMHTKYKRHKLVGGQAYDQSVDSLQFRSG
jgi:hypothetical protein